MLRHRLAALFEPRSLLILSSRELPVVRMPPEQLLGRIADFRVSADGHWVLPAERLAFLQDDQQLDMALLSVDPAQLPAVLAALRVHRPRALVLLPHAVAAADPQATRAACRAWGRANDCLVLGPGALGIQRPHLGLNLGLDTRAAPVGRVALVAQSRMIAAAVLDWAGDIQLGFSAVVSAGDAEGVTVAEILEYLSMDPRTDSIVLYLEEVDSSRHFTSALMAAASVKPVIVLKVNKPGADQDPASDGVFGALLRRTGAVRIRFFVQLFSALKVLVHAKRQRGRRVAIFSNGYGAAHLALDVMGKNGPLLPADLTGQTQRELEVLLEPGASAGNPVVSHAPLDPARFQKALTLIEGDANVDDVLVLLAPDALTDMVRASDVLASFSESAGKPIVSCFLGDAAMRPLRHRLDAVGLPAFRTPESATHALGILATYHYNQTLAQQTLPPEMLNRAPRLDEARTLISDAIMSGRPALSGADARWLLDCFHVPVVLGDAPVPDSAKQGIPMAIHVRQDPHFGPYIQFGPGGTYAQLVTANREIELPPLNTYLARQLIQRGPFWSRVLERNLSPAVFEHLRDTLERISEIVSELPGVLTLTIDPLWSDDTSLFAPKVQVTLDPDYDGERPENRAYRHMAIHPYPRPLVHPMVATDQQEWLLRPIRPEDASLLQEFIRGLSDESRYMRFVSMLRELTPRMLARYTRIDYDREVALVATAQVSNPENRGLLRERIVGFAHCLRNADGLGAEYALVIEDDWQRRGLGARLMRSLIEVVRRQQLAYIEGIVLASNRPMLGLMASLGFRNDPEPFDPDMRRLWLDLRSDG
ncbi:MAG: GNAT family N-acetyltransferase [Castellaniella sp.]|uniref:bifunctional acetate--CoA ligase family protein/GNAT family N-acetyltransferase n=1 Tax=Castellaniella sp. TaxID=1955812 RepID=UPI00121E3335|nr:GNAT family N-acetyltransferase [Castellaniella sp.]TAN27257.1 MAG: GNAT family N-acetyltransferase [Castellaniella sp.]